MSKRFILPTVLILTSIFSLNFNIVNVRADGNFDQNKACGDHLKGTVSLEACQAACTAPQVCGLAKEFKKADDASLPEDLQCFGCRKQVCEDVGLIGAAAKANCDAKPDHKSAPAKALADGTPCWKCEEIKNECGTKWPGTSPQKACEAGCQDLKICAKFGNINGTDCFACVPKNNPKPPKTCNDLGAITQAQCGTCVDPNPNCVPAGFNDQTGRICFTCAPKDKDCSDIGKANRGICNDCTKNGGKCIVDGAAPSGETCYQCETRKCKDIGKETHAICAQCKADGNLCLEDGTAPTGEYCYKCKIRKNCAAIGKTNKDVCGTCKEDEECSYVSSAENNERCFKCKKKTKKKNCEEMGMLSALGCDDCEHGGAGECVPAGKSESGEACYQCVEKKGCEKAGLAEGDCPGGCIDDQKCIASSVEDGSTCHACIAKQCFDYGLKESCAANEVCTPLSPTEGLNCCTCDPKIEEKKIEETGVTGPIEPATPLLHCDPQKSESPDADCGGYCDSNQECASVSQGCYKCAKKKQSCEDMKLSDGETCIKNCRNKDGSTGVCSKVTTDDFQTNCWECTRVEQKQACESSVGWAPGDCYSTTCDAGQKCVSQMTPYSEEICHQCLAQDGYTCPFGWESMTCGMYMMTGNNRVQCGFGSTCVEIDGPCAKCVTMENDFCPEPLGKGQCPANCSGGQVCENISKYCYKCVMPIKEETTTGETGTTAGYGEDYKIGADWKPNIGLGLDPEYKKKLIGDEPVTEAGTTGGETSTGTQCPASYLPGGCPADCTKDQECFEISCGHVCREKQCKAPFIGKDECDECRADGGKCFPRINFSEVSNAPLCYRCEYPESCEDLDLFSSCRECYRDEVCVAADQIKDSETGRAFTCFDCIPKRIIKEITWTIIIIETPHARYVLKDGGKTNSFAPTQIMALASADAPDLGGMVSGLKSIGSVFQGGVKSMGSLEQIAGMFQKGTGAKKKLTHDCFSQDFEEASSSSTPPDSAGGFVGEDNRKDVITNGPIIACGKQNGEDALSLFDAGGNPVETILQKDLVANPNKLIEALKKAAEASQKIMQMKEGGVKSVLSQAKNLLSVKAQESSVSESSDGPNDPIYMFEKKKKKKLLGILGSSKPVSVGMGGGGFSLSMGADSIAQGPKHPDVKDQWDLQRIGYLPYSDPDSAWLIADGKEKNILVAVIDSGMDMTHPDGPQYIWVNEKETPGNNVDDDNNGYIDDVNGWNFIDNNNNLIDQKAHGTFVAGIIAAKRDNGIGIAGINPGAVIMPIKAADKNGETNSLNIFRAIHYAVDHGARVINISLGGRGISMLEQSAINYAYAKGVFVVVASGNTGEYMGDVGPASDRRVFTVGAFDYDGRRSTISSVGPNNALLGPGELIASIQSKDGPREGGNFFDDKGYHRQSGTSFSTPMVAATASLMLTLNPNLTPQQIEDILMASADDMYDPGWDDETGAGKLNAAKALKAVQEKFPTVKITEFRKNYDNKKKLESVDVFATVRGGIKEYSVGADKGNRAGKYKTIAGPFTKEADNAWVIRLDAKDHLRGSDEWMVQISAVTNSGETKTAQAFLNLKEK